MLVAAVSFERPSDPSTARPFPLRTSSGPLYTRYSGCLAAADCAVAAQSVVDLIMERTLDSGASGSAREAASVWSMCATSSRAATACAARADADC